MTFILKNHTSKEPEVEFDSFEKKAKKLVKPFIKNPDRLFEDIRVNCFLSIAYHTPVVIIDFSDSFPGKSKRECVNTITEESKKYFDGEYDGFEIVVKEEFDEVERLKYQVPFKDRCSGIRAWLKSRWGFWF